MTDKQKLDQAANIIGSLLRALSQVTQVPLDGPRTIMLIDYFETDAPYRDDLGVPTLDAFPQILGGGARQ